jgi:hypothetical protein
MKQTSYWLALAVAASLSMAGCKREETVPPPASAAPPVASVAPAAVAAAAPVASALPVKEDYEQAAREAITEDNVEDQVKSLETEIAAK